MKKFTFLVVILGAMLTAEPASAAKNLWRQCGIGGMIFRETGWAAIISNIIWDLGTTATSSEISSEDMCEGKAADTAKFINETYANLEEETAVGSGEHLVTMLNIVGCDAKAHPAIISSMRSDLQKRMSSADFSSQTKVQKAEAYYNGLMDKVSGHAKECHMI